MDETQQLKQRIQELENFMNSFVYSDRYISQKHFQFLDGKDVNFGADKGTRIGVTLNQKLAFWGATPVVQHSNTGEAGGVVVGVGTPLTHTATFQGGSYPTAYTISDVVAALKEIGILKQ